MKKNSNITQYACDKCEHGKVKVRKTGKITISITVSDCDSCGYPHGFKSIQLLKPLNQ